MQNDEVTYSENMFTSKEFERNLNISINGLDHYRPMVIIPFSLFSDDFDPTVSIVTANRKGIWIYTCSFKSQDEFDNEISKTYILAMGNKGANHQPILKKIENEINTFRLPNKSDMFYHNILQKKTHCYLLPLSSAWGPARTSWHQLSKTWKTIESCQMETFFRYKECWKFSSIMFSL